MKTRIHSFVIALLFGLFAGGSVALADGDTASQGASSGNAAASENQVSFSDEVLARLMALFGADEAVTVDYPTPSAGSENPIIRKPI